MIVHVASCLESLGGSFSEVPIRFQSDSNEVPIESGGREVANNGQIVKKYTAT